MRSAGQDRTAVISDRISGNGSEWRRVNRLRLQHTTVPGIRPLVPLYWNAGAGNWNVSIKLHKRHSTAQHSRCSPAVPTYDQWHFSAGLGIASQVRVWNCRVFERRVVRAPEHVTGRGHWREASVVGPYEVRSLLIIRDQRHTRVHSYQRDTAAITFARVQALSSGEAAKADAP